MSLFDMIALLLSLAAIFSLINYKTIKLPNGIGIMLIGLLMSMSLIAINKLGWFPTDDIQKIFQQMRLRPARGSHRCGSAAPTSGSIH